MTPPVYSTSLLWSIGLAGALATLAAWLVSRDTLEAGNTEPRNETPPEGDNTSSNHSGSKSRTTQSDPISPESKSSTHDIVVDVPISALNGLTVKMNELARSERFRLLDCISFLEIGILRVLQYTEFAPENISYAAISYPWRDLQLSDGAQAPLGRFSVHGAEHADHISVDVLRTACIAARHFGASLLWLDRLSMMQSSKVDKRWQIQRMFDIYKHASPCLVFPGGLVRLARLDEPTTWIDRAWTLQEAAANLDRDCVRCVFEFPYTTFGEFLHTLPRFMEYSLEFRKTLLRPIWSDAYTKQIIEPGRSAACGLLDLFTQSFFGLEAFEHEDPTLGKDYRNFPVQIISPPAARLLSNALIMNRTINHQFVWISAFIRTSSRPVDMIFSFMGLMGVQLPVGQFDDDDRVKATIKLIQALHEQGRRATWLFIAPELPPSPELSTLPVFPETSVSGRAIVQTPQGRKYAFEEIGTREPWKPDNAPKGVMSDSGYFTFTARGARVLQEENMWAIEVGRRREHNRDPATGRISVFDPDNRFPVIVELTLMFAEGHGRTEVDGKAFFHRVGMENMIDEKATAGWAWVEREFSVGGQGRGDRIRFTVDSAGPMKCRQ